MIREKNIETDIETFMKRMDIFSIKEILKSKAVMQIRNDFMRIRILDNKNKITKFFKKYLFYLLISKSKILLIFKSEPKP